MKKHFQLYRPFLIFLLKFFSVYGGLTLLYRWYLRQYDTVLAFEVDVFSQQIAKQVQWLLWFLGYDCQLAFHESQSSIKVIVDGYYVSRIVEGCNALSVIILFVAFVVAFSGKWIHTLAYVIVGTALIHLMNIGRIALLSVLLLNFPEYEPILHGVVFPLIIYGLVFVLWIVWVNYFSNYAKRN